MNSAYAYPRQRKNHLQDVNFWEQRDSPMKYANVKVLIQLWWSENSIAKFLKKSVMKPRHNHEANRTSYVGPVA